MDNEAMDPRLHDAYYVVESVPLPTFVWVAGALVSLGIVAALIVWGWRFKRRRTSL